MKSILKKVHFQPDSELYYRDIIVNFNSDKDERFDLGNYSLHLCYRIVNTKGVVKTPSTYITIEDKTSKVIKLNSNENIQVITAEIKMVPGPSSWCKVEGPIIPRNVTLQYKDILESQ